MCEADGKYYVKHLATEWQWHDEIDANSIVTLLRNHENIVTVIVEGWWDIFMDKLNDNDYYLIIDWSERIVEAVFPPGPMR